MDPADVKLSCTYVLWSHEVFTKNWKPDSYSKMCTMTNAQDFWSVFNSFHILDTKMHYFLMKKGVYPVWEHKANRRGGLCSIKTDLLSAVDIWEELCCMMICDKLTNNVQDINGMSYSPKNNSAIIKIWNRDRNNDISKQVPRSIIEKYPDISIQYRPNEPEYEYPE